MSGSSTFDIFKGIGQCVPRCNGHRPCVKISARDRYGGSRDLGAPDRRLRLWAEEWRPDISSLALAVLGPDEQQRTSALSLVGHGELPMHQQWDRGVLEHMSCHAAED